MDQLGGKIIGRSNRVCTISTRVFRDIQRKWKGPGKKWLRWLRGLRELGRDQCTSPSRARRALVGPLVAF